MPNTTNPTEYGEGKRSKVRAYAEGDVALWVGRCLPVFLLNVPVAAPLGVASNGAVRDNTTGWLTGDAAERAHAAQVHRLPLIAGTYDPNNARAWANSGFHELGVFGVEGGPATGLVPGRGAHDSWLKLAIDDSDTGYNPERALVREVLGRNAVTGPGSWVSVPDQVTLGLVNNARCSRLVRSGLPEALRWPVDGRGYPVRWSSWAFYAGVMGWSAGVGGARHHLSMFADVTSRVPESERFGAWLRAVSESDVSTGQASHENPLYSAIRTAQKGEAGVVAAEYTREPGAVAFCRGGMSAATAAEVYRRLVASVLVRGGGGRSSGQSSGGGASGTGGPSAPAQGARVLRWLGGLALVAGATGAAVWVSRARAERLALERG